MTLPIPMRARDGGAHALRLPRLAGLLAWIARLDAHYRTRSHLAELDDRMLRDIGVTRADVDRELRRRAPFWSR
ncbi:hypothetical protein BH23PSE1_BH23PSE1_04190 [soil metagenome]